MRFDVYLGRVLKGLRGPGWQCTHVRPQLDGSLRFYVTAPPHENVPLTWGIGEEDQGGGHPEPVVVANDSNAPAELVRRFEKRLLEVLGRARHPLLDYRGRDLDEVALARGGELPQIWAEHFVPDVTNWGPFSLEKLDVQNAAFYLLFRSDESSVRIRVSSPDDPRVERYQPIGNLALSIVEDTRTPEDSGKGRNQVELFVAFVLAHSSGPRTHIVPKQAVAPNVVLWNKLSLVNQFMPEGKQGASSLFTALSGNPRSFFVVYHGDPSCRMTFPQVRELKAFNKWLYFPIRSQPSLSRSIGHDFRDKDIVRGAEAKLRTALEHAKEQSGGDPVLIVQTCVSRLIGEDVWGVVREVFGSDAKRVAVIEPDFQAKDIAADSLVWSWVLDTFAARDFSARDHSVNLFGFGSRGDQATDELIALLEGSGVSVNGTFFPSFEMPEVERFFAARSCVCNPCSVVQSAMRLAARKLGEMRWVVPSAPFGLGGTTRWLSAVLDEVGVADASAVAQRMVAPFAEELGALRRSLAGTSFAFSCDARYAAYLFNPSESFGIPLLEVLEEAGVETEIHLLENERVPKDLDQTLHEHPHVRLLRHAAASEVVDALRHSKSRFLFTSIERNEFALQAHKHPIYASFFEMGARGALRTLHKLAHLAQWKFCEDHHRYLGV